MSTKPDRKRASSRQYRPGSDFDQLVRVYESLGRRQALDSVDRGWLLRLLEDLIRDVDVRDRFWITKRGAPSDQDKAGRAFWCVMWMIERTPAGAGVSDEIKRSAARTWSLTADQVHHALRRHRKQAVQLWAETRSAAGLSRVVECHRQRLGKK